MNPPFVTDAAERVACAAIVRAVTFIARELSIGTVAEGVETVEQLEWIRSVGCREAQGYLFSKPVSLAAATEMLQRSLSFWKKDLTLRLSNDLAEAELHSELSSRDMGPPDNAGMS